MIPSTISRGDIFLLEAIENRVRAQEVALKQQVHDHRGGRRSSIIEGRGYRSCDWNRRRDQLPRLVLVDDRADRLARLDACGDFAKDAHLVGRVAPVPRLRSPGDQEAVAAFPDSKDMAVDARQFRDSRDRVAS